MFFVPLVGKIQSVHMVIIQKYPVADAGYGSYNNYLYCRRHGMEKYMKFTMYKRNDGQKYR